MGRLHLEVRSLGRADPSLPQTHGTKAVPLPPVPALFLTIRPSVIAHEAPLKKSKKKKKKYSITAAGEIPQNKRTPKEEEEEEKMLCIFGTKKERVN